MNTYTIKFVDRAFPDKVIEADDFSPPDEEWGLVLFYVGPERNETILYAVSYPQILSISVQVTQ